MQLRVPLPTHDLVLDPAAGVGEHGRAFPCHRCGVCCERWQPLLTPEDADRLASALDLTRLEFDRDYTSAYPFSDVDRLLRQDGGHCVFLRYDADSRSACSVHPHRPASCRAWAAGFDKIECIQGMARFATADGTVTLTVLYPDDDDRAAFVAAV